MRVCTVLACSALMLLSSGQLRSQTQIDLRTQSKSVDFSESGSTKPARAGVNLPATCAVGEFFFKTNATAGENLHICGAQNTWNLVGSGAANYAYNFAAQTTVTIPGAAHSLGTANLIVDCYDNSQPAKKVEPNDVTVSPSTYDVTVTFAIPQSGKCIVNASGGAGAESDGAVSSVFGRAGDVLAQTGDYSFSQISGTVSNSQIAVGIAANKLGGGLVSDAEFGYLDGVASSVQSQLDGKAASTHTHTVNGDVTGSIGGATVVAFRNRIVASTAPQGGQALVWSETNNQWEPGTVSGSGAGAASQLTDLQVTRTSATVLTIGSNCSSSTPCNVRFGDTTYSLTTSATATLTSGSGTAYIYVDPNGILTVGHNLTAACSNCVAADSVNSFPSDSLPLYTWSATNGSWDVGGGSDKRAFLSAKTITGGAGIVVTETGGATAVGVDTAVVGLRVAVPATSTSSCTSGSWASDAAFLYICSGSDTWRRVALGNW
jgi:hypothetical protein